MIKNLGRKKLGRTTAHRRAMLRNMTVSLIMHERVRTSVSKAKELRSFAEKVISRAKRGEHRLVRQDIQSKTAFKKLFDVLAQRYQERSGGYTRVLRLQRRPGDGSQQSLIKLVQ